MKKSAVRCPPYVTIGTAYRKAGLFAKIASNFIRKKTRNYATRHGPSGMIYYRCDTKIRCLLRDIILYLSRGMRFLFDKRETAR